LRECDDTDDIPVVADFQRTGFDIVFRGHVVKDTSMAARVQGERIATQGKCAPSGGVHCAVGCTWWWGVLRGVRCAVAKKFLLGLGGHDIVDLIVFSPFLKEEINET
jgi:hypothetical protein